MQAELRPFVRRFTGVVVMALLPVVLTAFISMPLNLNRHPGEPAPHDIAVPQHMT